MKRYGLLIVALVLAFAMSVTAFASETETRDVSFENALAANLKELGLFSGVSDTDFDLERAPSRTEVLVMLIRVLGDEKTALEGEYSHPFDDVPKWADTYVGYAYESGLTKGVSQTKFGNDTASAATYLTFMLRALGYSDAKGDFKWDDPYAFAWGLGMLPSIVDTENFWRADIVTISYAALSVELKNSTQLLSDKLIEKGVFSAEVFSKNYTASKLTDKENASKTVLDAEDIYANCSSAVFYIEIQNKNGVALSSGSGFFIDESGIAVTNWHVMDGAEKAVITLAGGNAKYDVTGVYYYSFEHDIAVIHVDGSGFDALDINPMPVKGAASVYAIGSPQGLQNTISQGIISNVRRIVGDAVYIQLTAAISNGSSGGVLLNSYGEVIGITSAGYLEGQNLNFARSITYLAHADLDTATPLEEVNWNSARYELREDSYTVKAGETITFEFDVYFYTADGMMPTFKVESDNPDVVAAAVKFNGTFIHLIGVAPGTANVTLSDSKSSDSVTFPVTVTEGGEVAPHIEYITNAESLSVYTGAKKRLLVNAVGIMCEEPETLTVTLDKTNIVKASVEKAEEGDYFIITLDGARAGTVDLTIKNDATDDTMVVPIKVGNIFSESFETLKNYIVENGELNEDEEGVEKCYYLEEVQSRDGVTMTVLLIHFPDDNVTAIRIGVDTLGLIIDLSFNHKGAVSFYVEMLGANGHCRINPKTFGDGIDDDIKFDEFEGSELYRTALEKAAGPFALAAVATLEEWLAEIIPGMAASDFGFIRFDYNKVKDLVSSSLI